MASLTPPDPTDDERGRRFSASEAALEGFYLIGRRWRVALGWAVFNLLGLVMIVVLTAVLSVVAAAVRGGGAGEQGRLVAVTASLVLVLGTTGLQAIIAAGVLRLELRPEEPAFLHLRLGRDEIRLVVVWLIVLVGAWLIGGVAMWLGHAVGAGQALIDLIALALAVWLGLRFSLALPASFDRRRIDFARSWRLTRGRTPALLGMSALSVCLILLVLMLVLVVLALVAAGAGGLDAIGALFGGGTEALQTHPGVYLLAFAVEVVLTPVLWMLVMAPLAAAYRALGGEAAGANP